MATKKVNGVNLYYEIHGTAGEKGDIVFLNGVMASASSWLEQAKPFVKLGYRVLLHDFRGQLKSEKPEGPYSFKLHAEDTIALMTVLGFNQAHFIGTSYGGEVAMKTAMLFPEQVLSLSIIDSVSELDEVLTGFVLGWKAIASLKQGELFFNTMLPSLYYHDYLVANKALLEKRAKGFNEIPEDYLEGQITLYDTFIADVNMTEELHKIKCPALVVCGVNDILKPLKFSEIIARGIENAEFITIPNCGHVTFYEKPDALNSALIGFVLKQSL